MKTGNLIKKMSTTLGIIAIAIIIISIFPEIAKYNEYKGFSMSLSPDLAVRANLAMGNIKTHLMGLCIVANMWMMSYGIGEIVTKTDK